MTALPPLISLLTACNPPAAAPSAMAGDFLALLETITAPGSAGEPGAPAATPSTGDVEVETPAPIPQKGRKTNAPEVPAAVWTPLAMMPSATPLPLTIAAPFAPAVAREAPERGEATGAPVLPSPCSPAPVPVAPGVVTATVDTPALETAPDVGKTTEPPLDIPTPLTAVEAEGKPPMSVRRLAEPASATPPEPTDPIAPSSVPTAAPQTNGLAEAERAVPVEEPQARWSVTPSQPWRDQAPATPDRPAAVREPRKDSPHGLSTVAPPAPVDSDPIHKIVAEITDPVTRPTPPPSTEAALPGATGPRESAPAKPPLAFGARLVEAPPAQKVEAATGAAPAGEKPQSRSEDRAEDSPKARTVGPHEARDEAPGAQPVERPSAVSIPGKTVEPGAPQGRPAAAPDAPESARPAARVAPAPEQPKAPGVARDIRIEVEGADRKVEVRLVERAGEVQLAVRTPDDRLAGSLREHLPSLSTRLEQSGFRADGWHAAEAGGGERRLEVRSTADASAQAQEQGHGGNRREQQDEPPRRPHPLEEEKQAHEKGTAFEWLMESLR